MSSLTIRTAIQDYTAACQHADVELNRAIKAAHAIRDEAVEAARKTCQAILDANAAPGIKITVGESAESAEAWDARHGLTDTGAVTARG